MHKRPFARPGQGLTRGAEGACATSGGGGSSAATHLGLYEISTGENPRNPSPQSVRALPLSGKQAPDCPVEKTIFAKYK